MTAPDAVRWSGVAAISAAVLIPVGALGQLLANADAVADTGLFISVANVGFVFLIFALNGIGRVVLDEIGAPGLYIVIAGTVGAVLLIGDGVVSAYVYPLLDGESLAAVQESAGLILVNTVGLLALLVASALLALVAGRVPALSGWAAWLVLAGAALGASAGLVVPPAAADPLALASSLIFATGLAWMGVRLLAHWPSAGGS